MLTSGCFAPAEAVVHTADFTRAGQVVRDNALPISTERPAILRKMAVI